MSPPIENSMPVLFDVISIFIVPVLVYVVMTYLIRKKEQGKNHALEMQTNRHKRTR